MTPYCQLCGNSERFACSDEDGRPLAAGTALRCFVSPSLVCVVCGSETAALADDSFDDSIARAVHERVALAA